MALSVRTVIFFFMSFLCLHPLVTRHLTLVPPSFDHLIRLVQHGLWNRKTDLFGCFEIDHKLEFRRLFYGQISRLGALENLVHVNRSAPPQVETVRSVGHENTNLCNFPRTVDSWQPSFYSQVSEPFSVIDKNRSVLYEKSRGAD